MYNTQSLLFDIKTDEISTTRKESPILGRVKRNKPIQNKSKVLICIQRYYDGPRMFNLFLRGTMYCVVCLEIER